MENEEEELNNLRIENEIKKIKLSLEHGTTFFSPSENKLSPELESEWLNQVQKFENSYAKSKRILIYDLVEKPTYKPAKEIPKTEIKFELEKLLNLLGEKGIGVDTICKVDDLELYRFITEELFFEETDDMINDGNGMTYNFIYEEFHPNHEYDIKNRCEEFVNSLLNKKIKLNPSFMPLSDEIYSKDGTLKQDDTVRKMEAFREAFSSFKLQHYKIESLKVDGNTALVCFDLNYSGIIEGSNASSEFSGIGSFMLKCEHDYWCINKISVPGVSL
jgi:hypothetical protein